MGEDVRELQEGLRELPAEDCGQPRWERLTPPIPPPPPNQESNSVPCIDWLVLGQGRPWLHWGLKQVAVLCVPCVGVA